MFTRHFWLRCLIAIVFFFALSILVPYMLGLMGITIPERIVSLLIGLSLLSFVIWGPTMPGVAP